MLKEIAIATLISTFAVVSLGATKAESTASVSSATEQKAEMHKHIRHHAHHAHRKAASKTNHSVMQNK